MTSTVINIPDVEGQSHEGRSDVNSGPARRQPVARSHVFGTTSGQGLASTFRASAACAVAGVHRWICDDFRALNIASITRSALFVGLAILFACGADDVGDSPRGSSGSPPGKQDGGKTDGGQALDQPPDDGPRNMAFRGPLNMGPDPFMTYHDGFYYLSTTQGDALRMWKARTPGDLLSAEAKTIWTDSNPSRNQQIWAPAFFFIDGKWYVYYCADDGVDDNHRLYVIESDGTDPLGPYHFKAKLDIPGSDIWAIDGEILRQNGKMYIMWAGENSTARNLIFIAPMSNPWTVSGSRQYLEASGGCPEVREGPSILQHDGTTFMVYSTCDTGKPDYQLWMKSIPMNADPMVPGNWKQHSSPIMVRNDGAGIWGPGHNGFFKSPDGKEDWIVYHAKNTDRYTYEGRTTRIDKVMWESDGLPSFGPLPATGADRTVPSGDPGGGPTAINDTDPSITYTGEWQAYPNCGVTCFEGDDHGTSTKDATATFSFKGTRITLLSVRDAGNGIGAISVDNGPEKEIDFYMSARHGEQLIYVSPTLPYGDHTLKVRATGKKNGASAGTSISIDRAEVSTR
jgi:GH43 family beta-xylosidase